MSTKRSSYVRTPRVVRSKQPIIAYHGIYLAFHGAVLRDSFFRTVNSLRVRLIAQQLGQVAIVMLYVQARIKT